MKIVVTISIIYAIYEVYVEISSGTLFKHKISRITKYPLIRDAVENGAEYTLISALIDLTFFVKNIHVNAGFKSIRVVMFLLITYCLRFLPLM